ncbi:MAG TPA: hypothetical protein DDW17_03135 [Deltaproteobacteria bacterium]|nr:hypothetical protein [Deltaproteobacteria bacterium]
MERLTKRLANVTVMGSMVIVAGIIFLTAFDVIGRFFGHAIRGAYQISEISEVWVICLAWPFTEMVNGHVFMDIVYTRLPRPAQHIIEVFTNLLTLAVFCIIVWQGIVLVNRSYSLGEVIPIMEIPLYAFQVIIPLAAAVTCVILIIRLTRLIGFAHGAKGG